MKNSEEVWVTAEGVRVKYVNMADEHLVNTIKFLNRRADRIALDARYKAHRLEDEYEAVLAEERIRYLEEIGPYMFKRYKYLVAEAKRRGFVIL